MRKLLRRRPSPSMVVALVALVVAAAGVTYAAIPDASGVIHACYVKNGGLRVINTEANPPETCRQNEKPLDWQRQGAPGSGKGVVSGLVRLAVGETKTVLQNGPFTITGRCEDLSSGRFHAILEFRSSEAGTVFDGVDAPLPANTAMPILGADGTAEAWDQTFAHIVAPSGATWGLFASAGVHTFGSDCAVAATASG